jgi:quinol monooxygenase YgiN
MIRRLFGLAAGLALAASVQAAPMYGLIGQMKAVPGKRAALAAILLDGTDRMPGCLSYVIAEDPKDADTLWITEVWDSKASHDASLALPAVRSAIAKGRPLIAGFGSQTETVPLGGAGLAHP